METRLAAFKKKETRRTLHNNEWWFSVTAEFGKGFDRTNLQHMRSFFMNFQIRDAVRRELSWTHYRLLLRVEKPDARSFFEIEAVNARWSTREL
jgi:hypothetical protein